MAAILTPVHGPRLVSLEIRGFRAFGTEPRILQVDAPLVVVHAGNSQGKTSLAEAIEFLVSGRSSRRELLGGAKAEYNDSLRNAHMPVGDDAVYVEAVLRGADGVSHRVRRELICDFGQGSECESRLLLDGTEVDDLDRVGVMLADPPMRAPVLLQHTLRHVLSTEPKQRVGYFKALLSLTDLDLLRDRVKAARTYLEAEQPGAALHLVAALTATAAASAGTTITALTKKPIDAATVRDAVESALLDAAAAVLGERAEGGGDVVTLEDVDKAVRETLDSQREHAFPLRAFTTGPAVTQTMTAPNLDDYSTALDASDRQAARIAPVIEAVLAVGDYTTLDEAVECPVCGTQHALTADRMALLRQHLQHTQAVDDAARTAARVLSNARRDLDQVADGAKEAVPRAAGWNSAQVEQARDTLRDLGADPALVTQAHAAASVVAESAEAVDTAVGAARAEVDETSQAVASRERLTGELTARYSNIGAAVKALTVAIEDYGRETTALRGAVEMVTRDRITISGLTELAGVLAHRGDLITDIVAEANRQRTVKRITAAEKALREATGGVLDTRFAHMSDTITSWWSTIRPEELVGFGGIKRRAGGALFVNLVAALRADPSSDPVKREALGVYSDSQLNALGLSIFLARAELLGSPIVVLDDPIPGSDADHRLTFVQNTLGQLLDSGVQVILTTFDSKLAEWCQANHDWRGLAAYELNLLDVVAGTDPTQTADTFSRLLLEAEENLNAPTARGRRAACGSYRSAAERLAKQIVATGRSHEGPLTTVEDIDAEASVLGKLVPLVSGYARDNAEKGQWRTFATVLNPGNHDDNVPSTTELKQVRGSLRKIAKSHRAYWPNGLLL
ncbi:AAA family ATPase [uncultured Brachybacterium sp.]|uniref:AAA family ATPase n=1 Tax=uncultured Brachybacterium sp. TaxID=189680 RepID=UPI002604E59B|nr:AAA family ATPase [uncultured Brachybacterium sp.]